MAAVPPVPGPQSGLFEVAERACGIASASLSRLGQRLLFEEGARCREGGFSDLNWNGSPLQLLLSSGAAGLRVRLIADPAYAEGHPISRLQGSLRAMEELLVTGQASALRETCWRMLRETLPQGDAALARYPTGMLRLALALGAPGVAVYAGAQHDRAAAWQRAAAWLGAALPEPAAAREVLAAVAPSCQLFGVAVEGTSPRSARLKIYFRLLPGAPQRGLAVSLLGEPPVLDFLADVMQGRAFSLEGLTFSASFAADSGALEDVKVDVCNRSAQLNAEQTRALAERHAGASGALRALSGGERETAIGCVGLGLDRHGRRRFNVYVFALDSRA